MTVAELAQKVYDLVAAVRNGNYVIALALAMAILKTLTDVIPAVSLGVQSMKSTVDESLTLDELCNELDKCCQSLPVGASEDVAAPGSGVLVSLLAPILIAMIKKLIGM